jgi:hypothetical protein
MTRWNPFLRSLLVAIVACSVLSTAHAQTHYSLTILPVHGSCVSMNNVGQILGYRLVPPYEQPVPYIFEGGIEHDIKNLYCSPLLINDAGQLIGEGQGNESGPILRDLNGKIVRIGYLNGTSQYNLWAINASGAIVGRD